jgi:glutathione S-transferase
MALTIYGTVASRAVRPLWVATELALEFEHIPTPYLGGATRTEAFLAINPNGHIPAIDDDGVVVWESMACALYLAQRFSTLGAADLWARTPAQLAAVLKWAFWAVNEVEKDALVYLMHTREMPPERRKPTLAAEAARRLVRPLGVLEGQLQAVADELASDDEQPVFLAGQRFTVADVCVASVLAWLAGAHDVMAPLPHVTAWLQRCLARQAYLQVNLRAKSG